MLALAAITTVLAMFSFRSDKKIIAIDAGHGGRDHGAAIESIYEKDIVNSIAAKISAMGAESNIEIVLLRDGDQYLGLKERVDKTNELNADLLISLHVDQDLSNSKSGVRAFVHQNEYHQSETGQEEIARNILAGLR